MKIGIHKLTSTVQTPVYGTEKSAGFDIRAHFAHVKEITAYYNFPEEMSEQVLIHIMTDEEGSYFNLYPNRRALIPTGLIFDIPPGYFMRVYNRSGIALKSGLMLMNGVGIIDEDYTKEVFGMFINTTSTPVTIREGDRIMQGIVEKYEHAEFVDLDAPISQKTSRVGGFNSTGKV